jgi:hypothetical protein
MADALSALGAKPRLLQALADDRWAVKFFTIKNLIESACTTGALNPDVSLYSVVGTRVVARMLTEGTEEMRHRGMNSRHSFAVTFWKPSSRARGSTP